MPKHRKTPLYSYKSLIKYYSSNILRQGIFRNLHMSGCQSPNLLHPFITRRKTSHSSSLEKPDEVDDPCDFVMFPTASSVPSSSPQDSNSINGSYNKNVNGNWNKNITGRRPLHPTLDSCNVSPAKNSSLTKLGTTSRNNDFPSHGSNLKEPSDDDCVTFLGEIKKSDQLHDSEYIPAQGRKSKISRRTGENSPNSKPYQRRLRITLRQGTSLNHHHIENDLASRSNDTIIIDAENELSVKTSAWNYSETVLERNNIVSIAPKRSEEDDDLVIIPNADDAVEYVDFQTLKRVVISIVCHFLEENDQSDLTTHYVLGRLKSLYHQDFSNRLSEIEHFMRCAISHCLASELARARQEIRPGIRHLDIDTLSSDNWLNDIIINQYMSMLVDIQPGYAALSSFWFEELHRGKEPILPENWETLQQILVPTCTLSHWSLLSYVPVVGRVEIYSSMPVTDAEIQCAEILLEFFSQKTKKCNGNWIIMESLPHQRNENDCGVYICMFARCIVCGNSFDIAPQQVIEFREWLKNEIIKGRLFGGDHDLDE